MNGLYMHLHLSFILTQYSMYTAFENVLLFESHEFISDEAGM